MLEREMNYVETITQRGARTEKKDRTTKCREEINADKEEEDTFAES